MLMSSIEYRPLQYRLVVRKRTEDEKNKVSDYSKMSARDARHLEKVQRAVDSGDHAAMDQYTT